MGKKNSKSSKKEVLNELSKYTAYILELVEKEIRRKEFSAMRYKDESDYNEVVALKKILNLMRFLLK
tara:strand:+ start:15279 stop:15479 length:201 start_codon:yes stop_codon:yes gene_type:complete